MAEKQKLLSLDDIYATEKQAPNDITTLDKLSNTSSNSPSIPSLTPNPFPIHENNSDIELIINPIQNQFFIPEDNLPIIDSIFKSHKDKLPITDFESMDELDFIPPDLQNENIKSRNIQLELNKIERETNFNNSYDNDDEDNSYYEPSYISSDENNIQTTKPKDTKDNNNTSNKRPIWLSYATGGQIGEESFSLGMRFGSWGMDIYKSFALEYHKSGKFYDFSIPHNNYTVLADNAVDTSIGMDLIYFIDFAKQQSIYIKGGLYREATCKFVRSIDTGYSYCNNQNGTYVPSTGIGYIFSYKPIFISLGYHINRGVTIAIGF